MVYKTLKLVRKGQETGAEEAWRWMWEAARRTQVELEELRRLRGSASTMAGIQRCLPSRPGPRCHPEVVREGASADPQPCWV